MKKLLTKNVERIKVNYFQRKPRKGQNFSLENIYEDIRADLKDKIQYHIYLSKCLNNGIFSKLINILEAGFKSGNDVNHITGEIHFLNILMNKNKVVLTILDCVMLDMKKGISREILKWLYFHLPINNAKFITAISEETKRQVIAYTKCNPDKIQVIPVAVSSRFYPCPKQFNENKPVVLQIGTSFNKNILRLCQALKGIRCHLTIIGRLSPAHIDALNTNSIEYSNEFNVSNKRILEKYQECDILSFISTSEGFGMPIVEANVVERVVITSNLSSMPEVAGNAACLVNPYSVEDIHQGFIKVISNKSYRENLIDEGRKNKLRYDSQVISNMYYDLYKKIYFNS